MDEVARMLVNCLRWSDGAPDADEAGLRAVADWLLERGRDADADAVHSALDVEPPWPDEPGWAQGTGLGRVEVAPGRPVAREASLDISREEEGDGADFTLRLEGGTAGGLSAAWQETRWRVRAGADTWMRAMRWLAIAHLLGYHPLQLLASSAGPG